MAEIESVEPSEAYRGGSAFELVIRGSGFNSKPTVKWAGREVAAADVKVTSDTEMQLLVSAAKLSGAGNFEIVLTDKAGESEPWRFSVLEGRRRSAPDSVEDRSPVDGLTSTQRKKQEQFAAVGRAMGRTGAIFDPDAKPAPLRTTDIVNNSEYLLYAELPSECKNVRVTFASGAVREFAIVGNKAQIKDGEIGRNDRVVKSDLLDGAKGPLLGIKPRIGQIN